MGAPKHELIHDKTGLSLLEWQLQRLSPHFNETVILPGQTVIHEIQAEQILDPADHLGKGPLVGMLAAMKFTSLNWVAIVAVDYPYIPPTAFKQAWQNLSADAQGVIFVDRQGRHHWLCGFYNTSLIPQIEESLDSQDFAVKRLMRTQSLEFHRVANNDRQALLNLNRPEDLQDSDFRL